MKRTEIYGLSAEELIDKVVKAVLPLLRNSQPQKEQQEEIELLTKREACKLLKITPPTLDDWIEKGVIKSYYLAKKPYIKRNDIMDSLIPVDATFKNQ